MNKMIENSEAERTRLIELIKSLELKLGSIEQRSVEEQWSMRQRQATLDTERVAFERERTFMREKMEEEEKRIQVIYFIRLLLNLSILNRRCLQELKEKQFSEHKRLMDIIDAERHSIQSERVKIETMARLKPVLQQTQSQGDRSEIDAAVKIAQDVARQTGAEREKLVALQHQCELERQELVNMKNTVRNKEHELERQIKESAEQTVSTEINVQPIVE